LVDFNRLNAKPEQFGLSSSDLKNARGVYIADVLPNSGAALAGLKKGDFITSINAINVNSAPQLTEQIARYHPGDKVSVEYIRNGNPSTVSVELKTLSGSNAIGKSTAGTMAFSGATLRNLSASEAAKLGTSGGVMVTDIASGSLAAKANIQKGFIIVSVNDQSIDNISDFQSAVSRADNGIQLGGVYAGRRGMYYYGLTGQGESSY